MYLFIRIFINNFLLIGYTSTFYKSVVAKLLYASSAWWGFASATDRQRVTVFLRRGARSGLYPSQQTADEIIDSADDKLFECVLRNTNRYQSALTSPRSYNLRTRCHDRTTPEKETFWADQNVMFDWTADITGTGDRSEYIVESD